MLGHVVEKAAGEPLDRVLEKRLFQPLGMKDTGFHVPEDKLERFSANYGPDGDGGLRVIDAPASSRYGRPATFFSGGGGLVSTAMDYMRFAQMLLGRGKLGNVRVLKEATVAEMTRNQLPDELVPIRMGAPLRGTGFGLGVSVRVKTSDREHAGVLGEYGWGGAASTSFWVSPAERLIGLTLTQYMPYSGRVPAAFKPLDYGAIKSD